MRRALAFAVLLLAAVPAQAAITLVQATAETFFKTSTAQASSLGSAQKCALRPGQAFEVTSISDASGHYKVTLAKSIRGCAFTTGYLYAPHATKSSTALTVHRATVFKKTAADSSTLPPASRCDLPIGVRALSAAAQDATSHYAVNFASVPSGCGFSQGYVFEEHALPGIQALTLQDSAWLKSSTADSSTLPSSQKCLLPAGNYTLAAPPSPEGAHYRVTLAQAVSGCALRSGYVFEANTTYATPSATAAFTYPLPSGVLGSGWCVCRNIGTSPHVGQDTYRTDGGTMSSVAIQDGTVTDITFDAQCGYILRLTDKFNTVWRYVHLNQPQVSAGQAVARGRVLGTHSAYPKSGCGSGAHLHWERRSAGFFGDAEAGKSCQNGFRTCHFDPVRPFRQSASSANAAKAMDAVTTLDDGATRVARDPEAALDPAGSVCRIDPARYARVDALPAATAPTPATLDVRFDLAPITRDGVDVREAVEASAAFAGNADNACGQGRPCIAQWQLYAQGEDGGWRRVFADPGVRNVAPRREAAEAFCAPEAKAWAVVVDAMGGGRYVVPVAP